MELVEYAATIKFYIKAQLFLQTKTWPICHTSKSHYFSVNYADRRFYNMLQRSLQHVTKTAILALPTASIGVIK